MIFFYLLIFVVCLIVIIKSGTLLVKSLTRIARFLRLSEYVVAFVLMAFATSIPELFVGIASAFGKVPIISFGDIIGANMMKMTLAISLVVFIAKKIEVTERHVNKDAWLIFFMALLPVLLALDGFLSRWDGIVLVVLFVWYMTRLLGRQEHLDKKLDRLNHRVGFKSFFKNLQLFVVGLALLLIASWGLVESAALISAELGYSLALIGLILVALGTTAPEISFGIRAAILKHEHMTLGNFFGSVSFNSLMVVGIVAIICPFTVPHQLAFISALFLSLTLLIFNLFIRTKKKLSRREGVILLMLYILFLIASFFIG